MTLPRIMVLTTFKDFIEAGAEARFTVRHHRNRETNQDEWPCCAIQFVGEDYGDNQASDDQPSTAEAVVTLNLNLVMEDRIAPESMPGDIGADPDPTGYGSLAAMTEVILNLIFHEGVQPIDLDGLLWNIRYDGTAEETDVSSPDFARVTERLVLQYRVRAEAPMQILSN